VRLRIRARDVAVAVGEPGRLSIRNRLAATVTSIAHDRQPMVEVRLDAGGDTVIASITDEAALSLGLRPGMPVVALIKSAAFDRMSFGPAEQAAEPIGG
jgi:molybdate transport system ATP-binding protein